MSKAADYIIGSSKSAATSIAKESLTLLPNPLKNTVFSNTRSRKGELTDILRDTVLTEAVRIKTDEKIDASLKELSPNSRSIVARAVMYAAKEAEVSALKKGEFGNHDLLKVKDGQTLIDGTAFRQLKTSTEDRATLLNLEPRSGNTHLSIKETLTEELKIRAMADTVIDGLKSAGRNVDKWFWKLPATKEKTAHAITDNIREFLHKEHISLAHTTKEQDANLGAAVTKAIVGLHTALKSTFSVNNINAEDVIKLRGNYANILATKSKDGDLRGALDAILAPAAPAPQQAEQRGAESALYLRRAATAQAKQAESALSERHETALGERSEERKYDTSRQLAPISPRSEQLDQALPIRPALPARPTQATLERTRSIKPDAIREAQTAAKTAGGAQAL